MNTTTDNETAERVPKGTQFEGYGRTDGTVGIRNRVLVLPSVICSHMVADRIADRVSGAVSASHDHGCAQMGADNDQTARTLVGVARNPNVAGALIVGLGCEHVQSGPIADRLSEGGTPVRETAIQDVGGVDETIDHGENLAEDLVSSADADLQPANLSNLTVGVVSSDATASTITEAEPVIGSFLDQIVSSGGRAVVAGTERVTSHPDAITSMAGSKDVDMSLTDLANRYKEQPAKLTRRRQRLQDLSADKVTQVWGNNPIRDVVPYGESATHDSGVALVDSPSEFAPAATALAAAGAQVIIHATGEGVPTGHPVAPVVKVTGDQSTYAALSDDIDIDATTTDAHDLLEYILNVVDGDPCRVESHGVTEFAINRVGPSM